MKFLQIILCSTLLSFLIGLIWSTSNRNVAGRADSLATFNLNDPNLAIPVQSLDTDLKPCSEVETMPCEVFPRNPLKEELDAKESGPGLFKPSEMVTCIYQGIFWWDNRDEFVKAVPMVCKVLQASEAWDDIEPNYQHIQVDCSKDLATKWSDQPGAGMVKNHKLNFKVRWYNSNGCYHFVQQ